MNCPPALASLNWTVEILYRGSLVELIGPYSIRMIGPYFERSRTRYLPQDGYCIRLVGWK